MIRGILVPSLALSLALSANQSQAALVYLCWVGNNGYTMTGTMEFPDDLLSAPMITEADVTRFKISGYLDGNLLGTWDMATRLPTATWYLRYFPAEMRFPTNGEVPGIIDQGWNADGTAEDCGNPGFGFNAGNYAQDFCVNGVWVEPSGMPPPTPFLAQSEAPYSTDCAGPKLMSRLELPFRDELG